MELPIKFPSQRDVIAEDTARFRALSPDQQVAELAGMYAMHYHLARSSPDPDRIAALVEADEEAGRRAVFAFAARHSG